MTTRVGKTYSAQFSTTLSLPIFMSPIPAGFPLPNDGDSDGDLDFNRDLLQSLHEAVYAEVTGDSMVEDGIYPGDLLVVDKLAEPTEGCIAVVLIDGQKTVKRISRLNNRLRLISSNGNYAPIDIHEHTDFTVWGVVRFSIRSHQAKRLSAYRQM